MEGSEGHFFIPLLILLAASAVLSTIFYRLKVPSLLAFLLVGLAMGPTGLKVVSDVHELQSIAELGLVFLLFVLGLEFSLPKLLSMRDMVFRLGAAQVAICTAAFFVAFYWWGLAWQPAFLISGGLALSSTAIVSRELQQLGQLHQRHGQMAIGVLLFQDLVAVALLISVPFLSGGGSLQDADAIALEVARTLALLVIFVLASHFLLPRILSEVARTRSEELLVFSALVIVMTAGVITEAIGLSMELGAFLAGMLLGESRFKHQLESDVRPFRDVLLGLFFISIGMLIDLQMLQEYWFRILVCGVALLGFKMIIISMTAKLLGENWRNSLAAGLVLAQGGEFLFALLALATRSELVAPDVASFLLSMTIVSMVLTPLLIRYSDKVSEHIVTRFSRDTEDAAVRDQLPTIPKQDGHVIILGFGRVGQSLARFLKQLSLPYVVLETDMVRIGEALAAEEPVYYGDSTRPQILKAAGVEEAALLVVSFDHLKDTRVILANAKAQNPNLRVLVRTRDDHDMQSLIDAGATEVIPETLEASLTLVSHALLMMKVPAVQVHDAIDATRRDRYKILHGFYRGERFTVSGRSGRPKEVLHAVQMPKSAHATGRTLLELRLPKGAAVISEIHREGEIIEAESFSESIQADDILMLIGSMDEIEVCEAYLLGG